MTYSFLPSVIDLQGLLEYVLTNPYLFVSSSTVMTSGLVLATGTLGAVATASRFVPVIGVDVVGGVRRLLSWVAPKLALTLAYFGVGSMALSTEILVRFHASIPMETEIQFRSGLGHVAVAGLGIAMLAPFLRRRSVGEWITANLWALSYWALQIALLTPPWFAFQGQSDLVLGVAKASLGVGYATTLYLHHQERTRRIS